MTALPDCDPDLYRNGEVVALVNGPRSTAIEAWIAGIREDTGQRVDWHLVGGWARVVAIGDTDAVRRAIEAGRSTLIAAYLTAPDNFTRNPEPEDVIVRIRNKETP